MRHVQIVTTCDACASWESMDNTQDVQTVPVGGQTLDLCGEHRLTLRPLLALVAEWGATEEKPTRKRGGARARSRRENASTPAPAAAPWINVAQEELPETPTCPMCGKLLGRADGALRLHLRDAHDHMTLGALLDGRCPLCISGGMTARELGHHAGAHGLTGGMEALISAAQTHSDPLGVLASRTAAVTEAGRS